MNKKGNILAWLVGLVILAVALGAFYYGMYVFNDVHNYREYKSFCKERNDFCYCSFGECEFKTSSFTKYTNGELIDSGMSNDTLELCNLANELNDKKMLFKIGCK